MKRISMTIILTFVFTAFPCHAMGQSAITGAGIIESTTGGFKFPDGTVQATAVAVECTEIASVPLTISSSGMYCFAGDLAYSAATATAAIQVNADDVVIDLKGWTLDGSAAGIGTLAKGIRAHERNNIVVRNGTIRGFSRGVELGSTSPFTGSQGYRVESIRAIANTGWGITINGTDTMVRDSVVLDTGGPPSNYIYGMYFNGPGLRLLDNNISGVYAPGPGARAHGVYLASGDGAVLEGNRIYDLNADEGDSFSIFTNNSDIVLVRNNSLALATTGVSINNGSALVVENQLMIMDNGIVYVGSSTGKYRDNLTFNVTTAFDGGTDAGGND